MALVAVVQVLIDTLLYSAALLFGVVYVYTLSRSSFLAAAMKFSRLLSDFFACPRPFLSRRQVAGPGDTVLDCTAGNGHDSLELARIVALKDGVGSLYIMDVQASLLRAGEVGGSLPWVCRGCAFGA